MRPLKRIHLIAIDTATVVLQLLPRALVRLIWRLTDCLEGDLGIFSRIAIARRLAKSCGYHVFFGTHVIVKNWENISLGNYVSIHSFSYLDGEGEIFIGDYVAIAHASSVLSSTHTYSETETPIRYNPVKKSTTIISSDVWIGAGSRILGGVTISKHTIVGANSVVINDHLPDSLLVGAPARLARRLPSAPKAT